MALMTMTLKSVIGNPPLEDAYKFAEMAGLDKYPIFAERHRDYLNQRIFESYWNRDIGQESIDVFRLAMHRRMMLKMPAFNQLYKSQEQSFDWLTTTDLTTDSDNETINKSKASNESTTDAVSRAVASDFPQTQLSGNQDYATNANDSTARTTAKGDASDEGSTSGRLSSHTKGYQGSPSALLMEFRATIINVDQMVIDELEDIFSLVLNNGDDYTGRTLHYGYGYGYGIF